MKSTLLATTSAALLSLSFMVATPAPAQAQFDDGVAADLRDLGFLPADWVVTPEQSLEIQTVVRSSETDQVKQEQIRLIMGDAIVTPPTMTPSERAAVALEDSVSSGLVGLGFFPSDWVITQSQALELKTVLTGNDPDQTKQERVRQIMGLN